MQHTATGRNQLEALLRRDNLISQEQLEQAQLEAETQGVRLERHLVDTDIVSAQEMALVLASYLNMPPIDLSHFAPGPDVEGVIPKETMSRHTVVPIAKSGKMLTVALGDPFDVLAVDEVQARTGLTVFAVVAPERQVVDFARRLSQEPTHGLEDILRDVNEDEVELEKGLIDDLSLDEMLESAEDAPVIRIVNSVMVEALRKHASDIHIESLEKSMRLRYRVDGMLYESPSPPKHLQSAIISRVKIMSNLNIAERRIPQDGRFKVKALGKEVDIRVSTLPTVHGEKVVMRILDREALAPSLDALGLDKQSHENLEYSITQPYGMILVTGPTGSGKTTTLYSALQELNQPGVNIITVEDPVEYQLAGINQVQTQSDVGLTFASGLRSILRQDPDIVMVGEIRDGETAGIAVQAALTGHLVLSTLHTNDAAGAVARMMNMGIETFLLSSSIIMTQAQRLYRKLCVSCKRERDLPLEILKQNHINPEPFEGHQLYEAGGCSKCNHIGYRGRGAFMEIMMVDDRIRSLILKESTAAQLREQASKNGMMTLRDVGLERVRDGITSIEEVVRVTSGE